MRLSDLTGATAEAVRSAGAIVTDMFEPTVRLGVTGLARSGKTVFITALVRCLTEGGADPALTRLAGIPGFRAYLEPQPDDTLPRFSYEAHLACLAADPPRWPESTRRISQLRLTLEWDGDDITRKALGLKRRVHIDILDYPGEWLVDLGLIEQSFAEWSKEAIEAARAPRRAATAAPWLSFLATLDPAAPADEQVAIQGASLFTDYLRQLRRDDTSLPILGPGRFLMPGDLENSPLLTFFPVSNSDSQPHGSLARLLERRFESYKSRVAMPFFRDHFSRLDRQIVLIDILSGLEGGAEALMELEYTLDRVLAAFRLGSGSWLARVFGHRIDRIAFAASKADHLNRNSHDRLAAVLEKAVTQAGRRGDAAGAQRGFFALAALRATEDVETRRGEDVYPSIRGRPQAGERLDGRSFDGAKLAVVFPGDLPSDPLDAFEAGKLAPDAHRFVRFSPPRVADPRSPWPHIGLDRAIGFLLGDHLP